MIKYVIRGAKDDDIEPLAANMRGLDRQEVWAASASTPRQALEKGIGTAVEAFTALADGIPYCMFGVSPLTALGNSGTPWLLTAESIVKHQRQLIKWSAPVAHYWRDEMFSILINYIDARHQPGLRWAKFIGFEILPARPHGPFKMPFHPIIMRHTDG